MKKIILILAATALLAGCSAGPKPTPKFPPSTIVKTKVGGYRGMVIETNCWDGKKTCSYNVRFPVLQIRTDTALLGQDGPLQVGLFARVNYMSEFELVATQ